VHRASELDLLNDEACAVWVEGEGASDLADFGASHGTRRKNEAAWAQWEQYAALVGFDPLLSSEQVQNHASEVGTLLATFLLYVYPKMKGKRGREWASPRSAFAYVLSIIRIFREWKLILPPAKVVQGELHGLLRAFVTVYGAHALMPQRREPFRFAMVQDLLKHPKDRLGARSYDPASVIGWAFRGMLALGWRTGHRLAEFVAHPSGEVCYVTRHDVSYIIAGVPVCDPSAAQLAALRPGDTILVAPPRSKTDQFGEIHSPFASAIVLEQLPELLHAVAGTEAGLGEVGCTPVCLLTCRAAQGAAGWRGRNGGESRQGEQTQLADGDERKLALPCTCRSRTYLVALAATRDRRSWVQRRLVMLSRRRASGRAWRRGRLATQSGSEARRDR
jgi:hypothetical protein